MATCNTASIPPQVARRVAKEVAEMIKNPPEGIKIIPNESDISDVQAIIYGPAGTPYASGHFRVKLVLGQQFPSTPPKGYFMTRIFHPNVSLKGEICVNTLKKDWKPEYGVKHILLIVKCLLIYPNPESALNEEAAKLLLEHYDEYFSRAKMVTEIHAKPSISEKENRSSDSTAKTIPKGAAEGDSLNVRVSPSCATTTNTSSTTASNTTMKTLGVSKVVNKEKKRLKRL